MEHWLSLAEQLIFIESHEEYPEQEKEAGLLLKQYAESHGLQVTVQRVIGDRSNIIIEIDSQKEGPVFVFNGHLDTVPPGDMHNAFTPFCREGRLYGRGAVDMKGFIAVVMDLLVHLQENPAKFQGKIKAAWTIGEESYSPGMDSLAPHLKEADFLIVGEPTSLEIGIAHKGVTWIEAVFHGKSAHGSVPSEGQNAIYDAAAWIAEVEAVYQKELMQKTHKVLGEATVNIGQIQGGVRPVTVPESCQVLLERRLLPGETASSVLHELEQLTENVSSARMNLQIDIKEMDNFKGVPHGPLSTDSSNKYVVRLAEAVHTSVNKTPHIGGLPFWTDAALAQTHHPHLPAVVFGPGSIAQAHSSEEWIEIEQLSQCFDILLAFITQGGDAY
ncbi:M20 family metallopeptidase [Alkalicoccus daliensis]|nr:M20 family metallopeptidase [Alkalicoccus daliensis]